MAEDDGDLAATMYPDFRITCRAENMVDDGHCDSTRVIVRNTLGWSPESGAWGDVSLVCLDCGNSTIIVEGV